MAPVRTSSSKFIEPSPRKRAKESSSLEKGKEPSPAERIKKCKSLVTIDGTTDQLDYSRKITKLIEDDKRKHSLLVKTMKELLDAMSKSREQLQHIETWFWDLVESDRKRQLLVDCAVEGFEKAGVFTLLADGNFTLGQLVKKAPHAKTTSGQGVYARLDLVHDLMALAELREFVVGHKVIPGKSEAFKTKRKALAEKRYSSLYIGSSRDIGNIIDSQDHFLPGRKTDHGYAHVSAVKKYSRVLCDLSDNVYAQQDAHIRLVVEQVLVTLLGTYVWTPNNYAKLIERQQNTKSDIRADTDETVKMEDIAEEKPYADIVCEVDQAMAKQMAMTSTILADLGREVCAKLGWQPITSLSGPNGQFGDEVRPLNWNSPIDTTLGKAREAYGD